MNKANENFRAGLKQNTSNPKTPLCTVARQPNPPPDHRPRTRSDHWKTTSHHILFGHCLAGLNHGCHHDVMSDPSLTTSMARRRMPSGHFLGFAFLQNFVFSLSYFFFLEPTGCATGQTRKTGQAIMNPRFRQFLKLFSSSSSSHILSPDALRWLGCSAARGTGKVISGAKCSLGRY
jgi:hypothetical protein